MFYLYHRISDFMKGDVLYPLNKLKDMYPDIYQKGIKKYKGREKVMQKKIPVLNCLWNDVVHLSAVSPLRVDETMKKYGHSLSGLRFAQIDPHILDRKKAIVYLYKNKDVFLGDDADWEEYNPYEIRKYSIFPKATETYYKSVFEKGGSPLLWHLIPHILYKGSLDISTAGIVEV